MLNRHLTIVIVALLLLGCPGRSQFPDSPELNKLLFSLERKSRDEVARNAEFYAHFLNEERVEKLHAFISKVGANGPDLTVDDFATAAAALKLLSVTKTSGMVEAAIPFLQTPHVFVNQTAAEVMAATGSEAAVEHLEAAFQRNMKKWLSGDPWAVTNIGHSIRCLAINGTPKARAAYDRSIRQVAEAVKTGNAEDQKWEREHIANAWEDVEKEKRGKGLPDPSEARRVGPANPREQPKRDPLGSSASKPKPPAPVAAVGKVDKSAPLAGGWALWAAIAAALVVIAGLALKRRS